MPAPPIRYAAGMPYMPGGNPFPAGPEEVVGAVEELAFSFNCAMNMSAGIMPIMVDGGGIPPAAAAAAAAAMKPYGSLGLGGGPVVAVVAVAFPAVVPGWGEVDAMPVVVVVVVELELELVLAPAPEAALVAALAGRAG